MAIRRQLDRDGRAISLESLLMDIADHPHVLSWSRHVALYRPEARQFAEARFDLLVGHAAAHIDKRAVHEELRALRRGTDAVKVYGTKKVAHSDAEAPTHMPTFKELDEALDLIKALLIRYLRLLRGLDYQEPVVGYDWKAIFREPWIPS
jgi:hypothetical protein